jgi:hypothetical protein
MTPPEWLVGWTNWVVTIVGLVAAVRALWKGGSVLDLKAEQMRARRT